MKYSQVINNKKSLFFTMTETQSSGGVVQNPDGLILIVSQHGSSWSLPKGHIEKTENHLEAAKREIWEETGIKNLALVRELGNYWRYKISKDEDEDISERKRIFMYHFRTKEYELKPIDKENPEAKWVPKEKVAELLTAKKDKEFFLSIIDQIA